MAVAETLANLRDVDDVLGSFLLNEDGRLLARDLPAMFHTDVFGEIGPRLLRLRETLESDGDDVSSLTLRFTDHKLHLRMIGAFVLGVITSAKVNTPALRMALNLVSRRIATQATRAAAELPAPASAAPATTGPAASGRVESRSDIVFRGRRF